MAIKFLEVIKPFCVILPEIQKPERKAYRWVCSDAPKFCREVTCQGVGIPIEIGVRYSTKFYECCFSEQSPQNRSWPQRPQPGDQD